MLESLEFMKSLSSYRESFPVDNAFTLFMNKLKTGKLILAVTPPQQVQEKRTSADSQRSYEKIKN